MTVLSKRKTCNYQNPHYTRLLIKRRLNLSTVLATKFKHLKI